MMPGELVEAAAARAYAKGVHPLDWAELLLTMIAEGEFSTCCCHDPRAGQLACKALAALMNSGWQPPRTAE
jgi:hypothetical protein